MILNGCLPSGQYHDNYPSKSEITLKLAVHHSAHASFLIILSELRDDVSMK